MREVGEDELLDAASAGRVLECGDGDTRRPVDAALLRRCCQELTAKIDPHGIRLRNAAIVGSLDLAGLEVPFPLRFDGCEFDSPLLAEGAQLYELALTDCIRLPGLLANGMRVRRDLDLSGTHVSGALKSIASTSKRAAIWLCESEIGGRLLCVDTVIDGDGERSIQADRIHVSGNIRLLHKFTARGEVRLIGARIGGSLDLTGASFESAVTGLALDLGEAVIEGSLFLINDTSGRRPLVDGRIDMGRARVGGQFLARNATLEARRPVPVGSAYSRSRVGGTTLSAPRLSVGGEFTLEGSCHVVGGMDLSMSELSSFFIGPGCALRAPGGTALDLTNAELLSNLTVGDKVAVEGTVRLGGTRIHGNLCLQGAILSAPEGRFLIAAQGVRVDGEVELQRLDATGGEVSFRAATIGSVIDATDARLRNPIGYTLNFNQAKVGGSVRLVDGFESSGKVILNRATVEGRLVCEDGSFDCPAPTAQNERGHAFEAISATIRGGMDLGWNSVSPSVAFTNTRTSFLADDPVKWPPQFVVSGLTYDRFEQPSGGGSGRTWDHSARCVWLRSQVVYDAGPYEQAARVFRQHGYTSEAEQILIAQHRHARQVGRASTTSLQRVRHAAYAIVGYGYRPWRVLWLLAALLTLVAVSLEVPAWQATLRATNGNGAVYGTKGLVATSAGPVAFNLPARSNTRRTDPCGDGEVRCFSPWLYAVDTVVPLVALDQRSTWSPDPHLRNGQLMLWWLNVATLLGWLLSSVFVLSLARLSRSP